jgi:hypothetical protein
MKRMMGLLMTMVGGIAILWAAYYLMVGQASTLLRITDNFAVSALTGGLTGAALFTIGLLWIRE